MSQVVIFQPLLRDSDFSVGQSDMSVGITVGTKMDPNYIIVNLVLPTPVEHVVIYKPRLTYTSLTINDLTGITSFEQFQQTCPEYFI